jgi:DNA-binding NarL/FixJ family response regulator
MKRITVLLAEDHTVVREGLRKMLELRGMLDVVGFDTSVPAVIASFIRE